MLYTGQLNDQEFPILLLEDNSNTVDIIRRTSKQAFPEAFFIEQSSVRNAMDYFYNYEGHWPKLIIVDIYLVGPEKGFEFLQFIKDHPASYLIPVIILSETQSDQDVSDAYSLGAVSFINKPLALTGWKSLLASIRSYWAASILLTTPFTYHETYLN